MQKKRRRVTAIAITTLASAAGFTALTARAATGDGRIHVDNTPGFNCSDTSPDAGSVETPFCTIEAAVATAVPGSDIVVGGNPGTWGGGGYPDYQPATPITPPSGTPGVPVVIEAAHPDIRIWGAYSGGASFDLDNVHDVVIKGFVIGVQAPGAVVSAGGADRITLADDGFYAPVHLTGARNAQIVGDTFSSSLLVDGGSTGTVIANDIVPDVGSISVKDSPDTDIVNNTVLASTLMISGTSSGAVVENNILDSLGVYDAATTGTTVDYNIVHHAFGTAQYSWNGTVYTDPAAFHAATGQGAHDIGNDPMLGGGIRNDRTQFATPAAGSPAIDSADASAPGIQATDALGTPAVDDPSVPDAGVGTVGYRDRGAIEASGVGDVALQMATVDPGSYRTRTFTAQDYGYAWGTGLTYAFAWGDGTSSPASTSATATHTYAADGDYTVTVTVTDAQGHTATATQGHVVFPRSRPDIVIADNPITSDGRLLVQLQSPYGLKSYVPEGQYTFAWGDGSAPQPPGGSNGAAPVVQQAHTYTSWHPAPIVTITAVDSGNWRWTWTFDSGTGEQDPAVSSPPSPGGWIVPTPPPPPPTSGPSGSPTTSPSGSPSSSPSTGPSTPRTTPSTTPSSSPSASPSSSAPSTPPPSSSPVKVYRDAGTDRVATGIVISQQRWTTPGSAKAVVLATSLNFPDALSGGPLAAKKQGPLLLTLGNAPRLDDRVLGEIRRVLPAGGPVYVLGGDSAMSPSIVAQLRTLGYTVTQFKGRNRAETALQVATLGMGSPQHVIVATGNGFADALAAGPYAAGPFADAPGSPAAIVLSNDSVLDPATAGFLAGRTVATVGTQAGRAWPGAAKAFSGADRFDTAARVAAEFTGAHAGTQVGIANGIASATNPGYPDALTGGAFMAGSDGPIVLVDGITGTVPAPTRQILTARSGNVRADIFGGSGVVSPALAAQIVALLHGVAEF